MLVGITWGFYHWLVPKQVLFQQTEITQLTTSGKGEYAAISPDGRYVAYTVGGFNERSNSLWVEQVTTGSDVQLIPPAEVGYFGLRFSRDGDFLYFVQSKGGRLGSLYKIPVLGGAARKLIADVGSGVTFSPDGNRLAFVRDSSERNESALIVANEDGSGEKQFAVRRLPNGFESNDVAWSPDGKSIATGADYSEAGVIRVWLRYLSKVGRNVPSASSGGLRCMASHGPPTGEDWSSIRRNKLVAEANSVISLIRAANSL